MEDYASIHKEIFGAIVFPDSEMLVSFPSNIKYKIRLRSDEVKWKTADQFDYLNINAPRNVKDQFGGKDPGIFIRKLTKC